MPTRTSANVERTARRRHKRGAVVLAAEFGLNPSTVGRILARRLMPHLAGIDQITGEVVRSPRRTPNRYEHRPPGSLVGSSDASRTAADGLGTAVRQQSQLPTSRRC